MFVGKKGNKQWIWLALDKKTREIVGVHIGDREPCNQLKNYGSLFFLGIWQGERLHQITYWLRWWDEAGALLLWSAEQAEQERQRAEQAEILLEQERQQAEQTRRGNH